MSLGYALVHPQRIDSELEHWPQKASFDDGYDLFRAGFAVKNPEDFVTELGTAVKREIDAIVAGVEHAMGAGGPLAFVAELLQRLQDGTIDFVAGVRKFAHWLRGLEPGTWHVGLRAQLGAVLDGFPFLTGHDFLVRVKDLAFAALGVLEKPFLSGKSDRESVRSYRAATFLRNLFTPVLDDLFSGIEGYDLKATLLDLIDRVIASVDPGLLRLLAKVGEWIDGSLVSVLDAVFSIQGSLSVNVGSGPSPMPPPALTPAQSAALDAAPVGFDRFGVLWAFDLGSSVLSLFLTVMDWWRVGGFPRAADGVSHFLINTWVGFRTVLRAIAPTWMSDNAFGRWVFSEWGEFALQFLFSLIGSFGDAGNSDNWVLSFGLRILKYVSMQLQPRAVFLSLRSWMRIFDWKKEYQAWADGGATGAPPVLSRARFAWASMSPAWIIAAIFGIAMPWDDLDIADFPRAYPALMIIGGILGALSPVLVYLLVLPKRQGAVSFFDDDWVGTLFWSATAALLAVIGIVALHNTAKIEKSWSTGVYVFLLIVCILAPVGLGMGPQLVSTQSGTARDVFHLVVTALSTALFPGVILVILWDWIVDDGRDKHGSFDGKNAAQSPYLLPYSGEQWMTGQGFQGIFSHTYQSYLSGSDNHFAYDFNNVLDAPALAARPGIVVGVQQDQPTNSPNTPNFIEVLHLDWTEGHDLGTPNERQLSYAKYLHLDFNRAWVQLSQFIPRGYHLADIDDTGISAQKHLHFQVHTYQRHSDGPPPRPGYCQSTTAFTIPTVFRDASLQSYRPFAFIAGKPSSLRFYGSDNTPVPVLPRPLWLWTTSAGGHQHRVLIALSDLPADLSTLAPLVVRTDVVSGHYHKFTIPPADVIALLSRRAPSTVTSQTAAGHFHDLTPEDIDQTASNNTNCQTASYATNSALLTLMAGPSAQLLAQSAEPYDFLGEQLVLRVDGSATEFYPFGAHRVSLRADLAVDSGPVGKATFSLAAGGGGGGLNITSTRLLASAGAAAWNGVPPGGSGAAPGTLRNPPSGIFTRVEPVLVVETIARGTNATLTLPVASAAQFGTALLADVVQTGSGRPDLASIDVDALTAEILARIQAVPPSPAPPAVVASLSSGATGVLSVGIGGSPVTDFTGSTPRIAQVLNALRVAAGSPLHTDGALPVSSGHVTLQAGANSFSAGVLATPAYAVITDFAAANLTSPNLLTSDMTITVASTVVNVRFDETDTDAKRIAARIMAQTEGVRAFVRAGALVVQTVAAGDQVTLGVTKGGFAATVANGAAAPSLRFGGASEPIHDTTALSQLALSAVINDAFAQLFTPAGPAATTVTHVAGDAIAVALAGTPVTLSASPTLTDPAALGAVEDVPNGKKFHNTFAAGASISLVGPGWVDVTLGADTYRVALEGEPARIDLSLASLPSSGTFKISLGGSEQTVALANVNTLSDLVFALNRDLTGILVRVASRFVVEGEVFGPTKTLTLGAGAPSSLPSAGFLSPAPILMVGRGTLRDATAVLADDLSGSPSPAKRQIQGPLVPGYTASLDGDRVKLEAGAGVKLTVEDEDGLAAMALPFTTVTDSVVHSDSLSNFALGRESVGYVAKLASGVTPLAEARVQLAAEPAVIVGVNPIVLTALAGTLGIQVNVPDAPPAATVTSRQYTVLLGGDASAEALVARLSREIPELVFWLVSRPPRLSGFAPAAAVSADDRICIATRSGGTGWSFRVTGPAAIAALGFDIAKIAFQAPAADGSEVGFIDVVGRGNVRDARHVVASDVLAAFTSAAAFTTQVANAAFATTTSAGPLVVSAHPRALTLETIPPELRDEIAPLDTSGDEVKIGPGSLALDNGWLLFRVAGTLAAAVAICGSRARIQTTPATPDPDAVALRQYVIELTVDGVPAVFNVPDTVTTLAEIVDGLAAAQPLAWIGLVGVVTPSLRIESRTRGRNSSLFLLMTPPPGSTFPAAGLLGFTVPTASSTGTGTINNLAAITPAELESLVIAARTSGAAEQAAIQVDADAAAGIRVTARGGLGTTLAQVLGPISPAGGVLLAPVPGRSDQLQQTGAAFTTPSEIDPGLQTISVTGVPKSPSAALRTVTSLLFANPARIVLGIAAGKKPADLNGKTLTLSIDSELVSVPFAGIDAAAAVDVQWAQASHIVEKTSSFKVRAAGSGTAFKIESLHEGTGAELRLQSPASGVDALTVFADGTAQVAHRGNGITGDSRRMTPAEFASAMNHGFIDVQSSNRSASPASPQNSIKTPYSPYRFYSPPRLPTPAFGYSTANARVIAAPSRILFQSQIDGCTSSLILLSKPSSLSFERSFERAPAIRASVALPAFDPANPLTAKKHLSGDLFVFLDDNGPASDIAPPISVKVHFDDGDYTATDVAVRIDRELAAQGVGCAAVFADGVIVVETFTPGIAGSIEIPSPSDPSTAGIVSALGLAPSLRARGWPTFRTPPANTSVGFRSKAGGPIAAGVLWRFTFTPAGGGGVPVPLDYTTLTGDTVDSVVAALDTKFKAAPGGRVGICKKGADGAIFIEAMPGFGIALSVATGAAAPAALAVTAPGDPDKWQSGWDIAADPGYDFRPTDVLRTYRLVYDPSGVATEPKLIDAGWVRPPTQQAAAGGINLLSVLRWPDGHYLVAARAEASKTDGYVAAGEMIRSSGNAILDGNTVGIIHSARYWAGATAFKLLGVRKLGSEALPYIVVPA